MTFNEAQTFAENWIDAWNRRDLHAVLNMYADSVEFISPLAATVVGSPSIKGKMELETYWAQALLRVQTLHFELIDLIFDEERRKLVIIHTAQFDEKTIRACEFFRFGADGKVIRGEAMKGASE